MLLHTTAGSPVRQQYRLSVSERAYPDVHPGTSHEAEAASARIIVSEWLPEWSFVIAILLKRASKAVPVDRDDRLRLA
jgi:hypothetical protein